MDFKKWLPELAVFGLFLAITYITFSPLFSGQILDQYDIEGYQGMSSEIKEYQEESGEVIHWTNSGFAGMPTYLVSGSIFVKNNVSMWFNKFIRTVFPNPSGILFIGLFSFYILGRAMGMSRWLSVIGAIMFVLGTFVITSLEAGHTSKINAYAYSPLILAGLVWLFKRKYILGLIVLAFGLSAQIAANHVQITFYLFLICLIYVIYEAVGAFRGKDFSGFIKASLFALAGVLLAVGVNYNQLATTYSYSKQSIRGGGSELSPVEQPNAAQKKGDQNYEYATGWSYLPLESMTTLIPRFMGGTTSEPLGEKSNWSGRREIPRALQDSPPTYWGKLPSTSSPVYLGALLMALFLTGFFVLKNGFRWWVLAASVLMLFLSWGKFSPGIYDLFYYNFPFFDKFRTPMMALLMLGMLVPLLGLFSLDKIIKTTDKASMIKPMLWGFGVAAGLVVLFGLLGSFTYSFKGTIDDQLRAGGFSNDLIQLLRANRISMLRMDSLRSLLFIGLGAGTLWFYLKDKKGSFKPVWVIAAIGLLSFLDIALVNKRYLNSDDYVASRQYESKFTADQVDQAILQDKDVHYRVFNNSPNVFQEANTSKNHKAIGGYSAAKLQLFQDVSERQLGKNNNAFLNMLNAKYTIGTNAQGKKGYRRNEGALGNAWFVDSLEFADSADEEMRLINTVNVSSTAVLNSKAGVNASGLSLNKRSGTIQLTSYHPEQLRYQAQVNGNSPQFAVFSEMYYATKGGDGWVAYIDGEKTPHYKTNYALRGLQIPAGSHEVVFQYEHKQFDQQAGISKISSIVLILLGLFGIVQYFLKRRKEGNVSTTD